MIPVCNQFAFIDVILCSLDPGSAVTAYVDPLQVLLIVVVLNVFFYLLPQCCILLASVVQSAKIEWSDQLPAPFADFFLSFKQVDKLANKAPLRLPVFLLVMMLAIQLLL